MTGPEHYKGLRGEVERLRGDINAAVSRHIPHGVLRPGVEQRITKDVMKIVRPAVEQRILAEQKVARVEALIEPDGPLWSVYDCAAHYARDMIRSCIGDAEGKP